MRKDFPGHFRPQKDVFEQLWERGFIIFDSNVLLTLYRFSATTREALLALIKGKRRQAWLPYQVAAEFFDNRINAIQQSHEQYGKAKQQLSEVLERFQTIRGHPFISDTLLKKLAALFKEITASLDDSAKTMESLIHEDPIKDELADIFNGQTGSKPTEEEYAKLCAEGDNRFKKRIPPGFKDEKKQGELPGAPLDSRKFGDYFLWKEILDVAKKEKRGVIFVTEDEKEDWWLRHNGKVIGPTPSLIREFQEYSGEQIVFYRPESFMSAAKERGASVNNDAIAEVRDFKAEAPYSENSIVPLKDAKAAFAKMKSLLSNTNEEELRLLHLAKADGFQELGNAERELKDLNRELSKASFYASAEDPGALERLREVERRIEIARGFRQACVDRLKHLINRIGELEG